MIDKPTTGQHTDLTDDGATTIDVTATTGGEWTEIVDKADKELEETVANFLAGLGYDSGAVKTIIRNAINAALAAERERANHLDGLVIKLQSQEEYSLKLIGEADTEIQQLREQLAAERLDHTERMKSFSGLLPPPQLDAAEREKFRVADNDRSQLADEIKELREQFAAEREVGHNQAVTLGQHIARLEDELAVERKKVELLTNALAKYEQRPVQLPMINDDPVVELK